MPKFGNCSIIPGKLFLIPFPFLLVFFLVLVLVLATKTKTRTKKKGKRRREEKKNSGVFEQLLNSTNPLDKLGFDVYLFHVAVWIDISGAHKILTY